MFDWLKPPQSDDKYEQFAYQSLHYSLLTFIIIMFILVPTQDSLRRLIPSVAGLAVLLLSFVLLRRGNLYLTGIIFLAGMLFTFSVAAILLNGINNAIIFAYVVIVIFAIIIFHGRREPIIFTALSVGSILLIALGDTLDIIPLYTSEPFILDRLLYAIAIVLSVGILMLTSTNFLRRSLHEATEIEKMLQAQNLSLQEVTQRLHISEERYRLLFENMGTMAAVYDSDGKIIFVNNETAKHLRKSPQEFVGTSIFDYFDDDVKSLISDMTQRVISTGEPQIVEHSQNSPTGKHKRLVRYAIPLPQDVNSPENFQQILGLATDITDKYESGLRQHELDNAHEKISFFTDFFGTVSHDMKTPLSTIKLDLYMLTRNPSPEVFERKVSDINTQVNLISEYIDNMLFISRTEYLPAFAKRPIEVHQLIQSIITSLQGKITAKDQICELTVDDKLTTIQADEDQLQRALINLIENAINYTPEQGHINVTLQRVDSFAVLIVMDSGIGISEEDQEHIFEPFYRAPEAKMRLTSGTGLGLAIVKRIIDLHEGTIEVSSELGQGTTFTVRIPC